MIILPLGAVPVWPSATSEPTAAFPSVNIATIFRCVKGTFWLFASFFWFSRIFRDSEDLVNLLLLWSQFLVQISVMVSIRSFVRSPATKHLVILTSDVNFILAFRSCHSWDYVKTWSSLILILISTERLSLKSWIKLMLQLIAISLSRYRPCSNFFSCLHLKISEVLTFYLDGVFLKK